MRVIAPSILSANFAKLGEEIKSIEKAGADWIHIDVMDGHFAPNITMGPIAVQAVKNITKLPIDVHLMIENPDLYIKDFAKAGADYISVHIEASIHLNRTINLIKECGAKAGVALNPSTPIETIEWVLEYLDFVLIMSVNPGFGGQSFIANSLEKIKKLKKIIKNKNLSVKIQIDGGVNKNTVSDIASAGVEIFVAGSAIFGATDYKSAIDNLKK
ncbi:MAG: ribulose-phosphate 3-epimerase [Deltaproteobacteria bacterium]|nr:ribulose-phosphate 3-epimerase [Deltaproteobacteria bacterium]